VLLFAKSERLHDICQTYMLRQVRIKIDNVSTQFGYLEVLSVLFFLIGLRGSGKTTIGRLVASQRMIPVIDMDARVIDTFPEANVSDIWQNHGQKAWRKAERDICSSIIAHEAQRAEYPVISRADHTIISTGGGAPEQVEVWQMLYETQQAGVGCVIYLRCTPDVLYDRMDCMGEAFDNRPAITNAPNHRDEISTLYERRDPIYQQLAHETINADAASEREVADAVLKLIGDMTYDL